MSGDFAPISAAQVPCQSPSTPGRLTGDHLLAIREAVARSVEASHLDGLAARIRAGEMDNQPMMCAAIAAVSAVLALDPGFRPFGEVADGD